jgi:hypothetical protein
MRNNMDRKKKHRIATSLGLVALPRGYARPEVAERIEREVSDAEQLILKRAIMISAKRDNPGRAAPR